MSHTVHPYSHRLGIIRDWKSRWFSVKPKYKELLKEDLLIRAFLNKRLKGFFVSLVSIERSQKALKIIVETSRPGVIIGRSGEGATKLREELLKELKRLSGTEIKQEVKLDIREVKAPESNATIVGQMVAEGLEKRMPFRRVMKQVIGKVVANKNVLGVKVLLAGRLGGATMARTEHRKIGRIPLQTFRADIDFARVEAMLPYGKIGIKVWIYKGEIFAKKQGE